MGIYDTLRDIRVSLATLDIIISELTGKPEYNTQLENALREKTKLKRMSRALREIETSVSKHLQEKHPDVDITTTEGRKLLRDKISDMIGDSGKSLSEDETESAIKNASDLVEKIKSSMSGDFTKILDKIGAVEKDVSRLQLLVKNLSEKADFARSKVGTAGLFSRLQDTIGAASQITGTVTIRGVRHTVVTYVADDPVPKMFSSRFKNLEPRNMMIGLDHRSKVIDDAIRTTKSSDGFSKKNILKASDLGTVFSKTNPETLYEGVNRFIALVPTSPFSIALPADKAFSVVLQSVADAVRNKTYTFRTHDPVTYVEKDTGHDIQYQTKLTKPSFLEHAILRLSLEYLDVIYKYLINTNGTTRGYTAILPSSVFGMRLPSKLFQKRAPLKTKEGSEKLYTGTQNMKVIWDLISAYEESDPGKRIPFLLKVSVKDINDPQLGLRNTSERIRSSRLLPNTISQLSQIYVRFARQATHAPIVKVGLQDSLVGIARVHDFPVFVVSKDIVA